MNGNEPTDRQREMMAVISSYIERNGYSPTVREIAELMGGRSTNAVADMLYCMRKKGLVDWKDGLSRTVRVLPPRSEAPKPEPRWSRGPTVRGR